MKHWLWINPVTQNMYDLPALEAELLTKGFTIAVCAQDHIDTVRQKYRAAITAEQRCIADMRCPMAVNYIKNTYHPKGLIYPNIEPILLHCARELYARMDKTDCLIVTTPCAALSDMGNRLKLSNVNFLTWAQFARLQNITQQPKPLQASPIPPGFFSPLNLDCTVLDSKSKIDRYFSASQNEPKKNLLELLYCAGGCHNGDGL